MSVFLCRDFRPYCTTMSRTPASAGPLTREWPEPFRSSWSEVVRGTENVQPTQHSSRQVHVTHSWKSYSFSPTRPHAAVEASKSLASRTHHNVQLPPSEPRIVAPVSGHRGGARSTGRERNWSYELTSATATGWSHLLSIRSMLRAVRDSDTAERSTQQVAAATEVQRSYESCPE